MSYLWQTQKRFPLPPSIREFQIETIGQVKIAKMHFLKDFVKDPDKGFLTPVFQHS